MTPDPDRLGDLENRVRYLELKADPPPPEDIRAWVATFYESQTDAAKAAGVTVNYVHQCMSGRRSASKKIIEKMISDGFYGPDAMERQK